MGSKLVQGCYKAAFLCSEAGRLEGKMWRVGKEILLFCVPLKLQMGPRGLGCPMSRLEQTPTNVPQP